jgi:heptaprenyl diphosphate synthase
MQADTFERLVLGQLHETVGPTDGEDPIAHYIQVLADKTGSLIAARRAVGRRVLGADPAFEKPIVEFGEKIGVAFQLIDDVIDLSPQPEETGKVPGTDLRAGRGHAAAAASRRARTHGCRIRRPAARIERDVIVVAEPARGFDPHDTNTQASRIVPSRRPSTRSSPSSASTRPRALRSLRPTGGRARPLRRSRRCPRAA